MGRTNSLLMYTRNLQHIGSGETSSKYGGGGGDSTATRTSEAPI